MQLPLSEDADQYLRLVAELDALDQTNRLHTQEAATLRGRVKLIWQILSPGEQKVLRMARAEPPAKKTKERKPR